MKTQTEQDLFKYEMEHFKGGNGWVVVQVLPNEYCRVMDYPAKDKSGKLNPPTQAFLACTRPTVLYRAKVILNTNRKPEEEPVWGEVDPLPNEVVEVMKPIREGLASGKLKVVNTRIVENPF